MGFPRQEYWIVLPFPSPGDLLHSGIEPGSPASQADSLPTEPLGKSNLKFLPNLNPPMVSLYSSDKKKFFYIYLSIYLAVPGFSTAAGSSLKQAGCLVAACELLVAAWGI